MRSCTEALVRAEPDVGGHVLVDLDPLPEAAGWRVTPRYKLWAPSPESVKELVLEVHGWVIPLNIAHDWAAAHLIPDVPVDITVEPFDVIFTVERFVAAGPVSAPTVEMVL